MPSSTAAPPPAPRQRRKEARPHELLAAALDVFVEKGFAASRSEEVATRAGVSKGTLYLYYPSKEELLKAVIRHYLGEQITAGAAELAAQGEATPAALFGVLTRWWQRVYDSPASGVFKLIVTEARNFPEIAAFYVREVIEPGEALIGRLIERGIANGQLRPANVANITHSLLLPMVMLCLHKHSMGACMLHEHADIDPQSFIEDHIALVLRALQADTPPPK